MVVLSCIESGWPKFLTGNGSVATEFCSFCTHNNESDGDDDDDDNDIDIAPAA